ncbi:VOC family protein [Sedimentitalea sp. JM2-8]|uniref:VOC family protein n=1 Tax=Sedimentitalea xiamensis TaxID=3050037 RepID=A0ABT7FIH8_9RHOB|nr:VOC family protein [Sedimentitalea xiamensis]MDK3074942.1 VOC family protein [Sedimentitalea xiamensis]
MIRLDHIAVAGATLAEAVDWVECALGVPLQPGGKHGLFGTHNRLLGLSDALYLEAIAVDPAAPPPGRARWFGLDRFSGPARLTNWICATDDMDAVLARLPGAGRPVPLARGDLRWTMAVPDDGMLPFDNLHPALICWSTPTHPSATLARSGCRLRRLLVSHPQADALADILQPVLADTRVVLEPGAPGLLAEMETPHGIKVLR